MKAKITFILFILCSFQINAQEIIHISSFDGEVIEGRLNFPSAGFKNKIVIDVPGTGPFTYETKRKIGTSIVFKFHDYFANEFVKRGIAYFSYSTRYTVPDTIPPYYDKVNKDKFFSYTPSVKVKDLEEIIKFLRNDRRLDSCCFILLGQSAGAIIASLVAERNLAPVDALFLVGTPSDDVYTTILWQHSGAASMINYRKFFDTNKDSIIQKSEYENGDPRAIRRVGSKKFDELDMDQDSVLTAEDFRLLLQPRLQQILTAIEKNDNDWIWNNFYRIGTQWIKEHRTFEPNKTRLLRLDLPIFIFHGENDANSPVEGINQIQRMAYESQKENIEVFVFPDHGHSLEFLFWVVRDSIPDGLETLFDQAEKF